MTTETRPGPNHKTWPIRTAAAASVLTVVLAAGAGAALAGLGDSSSGRTGFNGPGGPGGFAPRSGQAVPSPGTHKPPSGALRAHRLGLGQSQLPPVTRTEGGDSLDT